MGHGVTATDKIMSVRETVWHGFADVLPDYISRAEAQALTMSWEPITSPIFGEEPIITPEGDLGVEYQPLAGYRAVRRSDNAQLLGVVSDTYTPVSNQALWDIAEAVEGLDPASVQYETAGSLRGGKSVWVAIRLREPLFVDGDPNGTAVPFYIFQNTHDGSGALQGKASIIRPVCQNTWTASDLDAKMRGTAFTFRHTAKITDRIEQAKTALAGWRQSVADFQQWSLDMVGLEVSKAGVEEFLERFIPAPPAGLASERVMANVLTARGQVRDILDGPTCEGISGTAWGLFQAATEYGQWVRPARTPETAFKRSVLTSSDVTMSAARMAREAALV
jgi:phage/plasmid-like protein (TIGR03299 family)